MPYTSANYGSSVITSPISSIQTTNIPISPSDLAKLPTSGPYYARIRNAANTVSEIVLVTGGFGTSSLTIVRAAESGTTNPARGWSANDIFEQVVTAGLIARMIQVDSHKSQAIAPGYIAGATGSTTTIFNPDGSISSTDINGVVTTLTFNSDGSIVEVFSNLPEGVPNRTKTTSFAGSLITETIS